jgi:pyrroline-5-carboxylate reductase
MASFDSSQRPSDALSASSSLGLSGGAAPALPVCIVGFGVMGSAIVKRAVERGVLTAASLTVVDPTPAAHAAAKSLGITRIFADVSQLEPLSPRGMLLLAIKPQMFAEIQRGFASSNALPQAPGMGVISIMAGVTLAALRGACARCHVIRAMPNTPSQIGQGATAIAADPDLPIAHMNFAMNLFLTAGPTVVQMDESLIDAATAVAGSGPAYVFSLAEAMIAGARNVGLSAEDAQALVRQTIIGAAALMKESGQDPGSLRQAVTSKGGTTQAALETLAARQWGQAMVDAIAAARDRGRQLGS